jgi:hypothetical protein
VAGPYYIRKTGNDANSGLSPAAAWLTIQKAHNAAAGPTGGEIVYIGAGTYRENVTANMTSPTSELQFIGDVDGSKTGDAGPVVWSAYTTNDTTAPATQALVLNGRDFLTYEGIYFQGGTTYAVLATTLVSTNISFRRCVVTGHTLQYAIYVSNSANVPLNWTLQECSFGGAGISTRWDSARHTSDYDLNVQIRNCIFHVGSYGVYAISTGAGAGKPGGIDVLNCIFLGCSSTQFQIADANFSTAIPCTIYNSILWNGNLAVQGGAAGQLLEDYNYLNCQTNRSNVTAGTNSVTGTTYAPRCDLGYAALVGMMIPRQPFEPLDGSSPFLGFNNTGGPPTIDWYSRPRPAGSPNTNNAIGPFERHDTATKETTTTDAGSVGLKITGLGDHDIKVPVNATSTLLSIRVRYDTNHAATNKPQAILLANPEIGITTETKTATVGVDTWETLTFAAQTPSARGVVTIRLVSRAAAGNGIAFFDTLAAPDIDLGDFGHFMRGEPVRTVSGAGGSGSVWSPVRAPAMIL